MKKIIIFISILILSASCSNAGKTGTSYNNDNSGSANNTGETLSLEQEKKNKEWINKVKTQKIKAMNYYFDNEGNIINNNDSTKMYTFYKYLDAYTAIYYYEGDPAELYDIGDSISGINAKVYCLVKIDEEHNKMYFLDGKQPQNCTEKYSKKITYFVAENNENPNWSSFPYMTENDINTTIDIKDKRWSDWGYFGSNIVG
ncbi:hypothetical protein BHAMNSH16_00500 [Brachyspira hampsonii]|uniref:Uncharacterized protein n=2 Tax=Brachyspira hampsonii TaxID=1287055 RepID=A0AAC9TRU0_9SPIR|nr:hypothetical protein [Brachyspira hampsonii]ASJ20213.1 hypothetical protein BHAMNSH16_00500 [Brachyspira hampsonii]MBW5381009.1 hypothetical protein [Brachyspira hampsonii]MBW5411253.1 hypothetical protein [Brachyspira hampsonii]OEJ17040.1 hypothetical protein A9496_12080 [Brachyspira hampsonii]